MEVGMEEFWLSDTIFSEEARLDTIKSRAIVLILRETSVAIVTNDLQSV